jgi:iron complex outermembrane recepter protein
LDNRLQLNFGLFEWKYKDIQDQRVNFDPDNNPNFITFNSGDATLYGANVDIIAKPTSADTFRLAGEFDHSKYDNFFYQVPVAFYLPGSSGCKQTGPYAPGSTLPYTQQSGSNVNNGPLPVVVQNCTGYQVARVPKWSANLSYAHDFTLPGGATITLDEAVKYQSASWLNVDFTPSERQTAYAVLDANLTYTPLDGRWSAGAFGRNLTDKAYYTGGIASTFVGGLFNGNIAPPRTYGVRASFKFGT